MRKLAIFLLPFLFGFILGWFFFSLKGAKEVKFLPTEAKALLFSENIPINMGSCYPCHINLDRKKRENPRFNHQRHLELAIACSRCHLKFAHLGDKIEFVPKERCFICHRPFGTMGKKCFLCHPPGYEGKKIPTFHQIGLLFEKKARK